MKIKLIKVENEFKYLWLKTVEDVDLSVHCARCLKGKYDSRIRPFKGILEDLELDDKIYYLCGVSQPYKWSDNFHLAFVPSEGNVVDVNEHGIHIIIENAERINISPDYIDSKNPKSHEYAYKTCRNWQFANMFKLFF